VEATVRSIALFVLAGMLEIGALLLTPLFWPVGVILL